MEKYVKRIQFLLALVFVYMLYKIGWQILLSCKQYEINHAYTADAPLYWAVGRGILNGIKPYVGLYENKPIGIFLISAISFYLTDTTWFCNMFCYICVAVIGIIPFVYVTEDCICNRISKQKMVNWEYIPITLGVSIFVMLYTEERAGGFQVESMGAAFVVLFYICILHIKWKQIMELKKVTQIIWSILAGLCLAAGVMMKEPFVVVAFAGAILFCSEWNEYIGRVIIPFVLGGVFSIVQLVSMGIIKGYFTVYLKNMMTSHIYIYGTPFTRMWELDKITTDLSEFSLFFCWSIIILFVCNIIVIVMSKNRMSRKIIKIVKLLLTILLTSFTVGLGGQYYNHHFVFAVPFYVALLLSFYFNRNREVKLYKRIILDVMAVILIIGVSPFESVYFEQDYTERYNMIEARGDCVDKFLEYYGEDTYQFFGFNGEDKFYGMTHISPQGPSFVQDSNNFEDADNWFCQSMFKQLDAVNIIFVETINMPAINEQVEEIIARDFTDTPKNVCEEAQWIESMGYKIYYRKSKFE